MKVCDAFIEARKKLTACLCSVFWVLVFFLKENEQTKAIKKPHQTSHCSGLLVSFLFFLEKDVTYIMGFVLLWIFMDCCAAESNECSIDF